MTNLEKAEQEYRCQGGIALTLRRIGEGLPDGTAGARVLHVRQLDQIRTDGLLPVAHGGESTGTVGQLEGAVRVRLGLQEWDEVVQMANRLSALSREHDEVGGEIMGGMLIYGHRRGCGGEADREGCVGVAVVVIVVDELGWSNGLVHDWQLIGRWWGRRERRRRRSRSSGSGWW